MTIVQMIVDSILRILHKRSVWKGIGALNAIGTVFGFMWYRGQVDHTLFYLRIFVPDSPVAALFFTLALCGILWPPASNLLREAITFLFALGVTSLFQYGLWAVIVLTDGFFYLHSLPLEGVGLWFAHAGMLIEALVFTKLVPLCTYKARHIATAFVWLFFNDYADYVYGVFPYLPRFSLLSVITVVTPLLSVVTLFVFWPSITPKLSRKTLS